MLYLVREGQACCRSCRCLFQATELSVCEICEERLAQYAQDAQYDDQDPDDDPDYDPSSWAYR